MDTLAFKYREGRCHLDISCVHKVPAGHISRNSLLLAQARFCPPNNDRSTGHTGSSCLDKEGLTRGDDDTGACGAWKEYPWPPIASRASQMACTPK